MKYTETPDLVGQEVDIHMPDPDHYTHAQPAGCFTTLIPARENFEKTYKAAKRLVEAYGNCGSSRVMHSVY
jgi:hypothetical protein